MSAAVREEEGFGGAGVVGRLRDAVLTGGCGRDERLVEEQVAGRLGVGRTPVWRALMTLEAEGLVEISPNRGATVCSFSLDDAWDVYVLRAVLQGHAARRAAARDEEPELTKLRELAAEMEGAQPGRFGGHEEEVRWLVERNGRLRRPVERAVGVPLVLKAFFWYGPAGRAISTTTDARSCAPWRRGTPSGRRSRCASTSTGAGIA